MHHCGSKKKRGADKNCATVAKPRKCHIDSSISAHKLFGRAKSGEKPRQSSIRVAIRVALTGYVTVSVIHMMTEKTSMPSILCPDTVSSAGVGIIKIIAMVIHARSKPYFLKNGVFSTKLFIIFASIQNKDITIGDDYFLLVV